MGKIWVNWYVIKIVIENLKMIKNENNFFPEFPSKTLLRNGLAVDSLVMKTK